MKYTQYARPIPFFITPHKLTPIRHRQPHLTVDLPLNHPPPKARCQLVQIPLSPSKRLQQIHRLRPRTRRDNRRTPAAGLLYQQLQQRRLHPLPGCDDTFIAINNGDQSVTFWGWAGSSSRGRLRRTIRARWGVLSWGVELWDE